MTKYRIYKNQIVWVERSRINRWVITDQIDTGRINLRRLFLHEDGTWHRHVELWSLGEGWWYSEVAALFFLDDLISRQEAIDEECDALCEEAAT